MQPKTDWFARTNHRGLAKQILWHGDKRFAPVCVFCLNRLVCLSEVKSIIQENEFAVRILQKYVHIWYKSQTDLDETMRNNMGIFSSSTLDKGQYLNKSFDRRMEV